MKLKIVLTAIFLLVNYMFAQDNDYIYINFSKSDMFQVCNFVIIDGNTVKTESYEIFKGDMIFKDFHFTGWQKRNKLSTEKIITLGDSFYIGKLKFSKDLKNSTDKIIHLSDERLSSKAADSLLGDKKTKAARDAVAAMLILQSFLDLSRS